MCKLIVEPTLEGVHFLLGNCQIHYILKLLEERPFGLFKDLGLFEFPVTVNEPIALNDNLKGASVCLVIGLHFLKQFCAHGGEPDPMNFSLRINELFDEARVARFFMQAISCEGKA